jgi:hypothetical protein
MRGDHAVRVALIVHTGDVRTSGNLKTPRLVPGGSKSLTTCTRPALPVACFRFPVSPLYGYIRRITVRLGARSLSAPACVATTRVSILFEMAASTCS